MKTGFDVRNMAGTFYELAMHDYTQNVCVAGPTCVRSQKVIDGLTIRDDFTIACFGRAYSSALEFRIVPEKPGYLEGRWSAVTGDRVIPDTVVEFKESLEPESDAQYEWVIEVQCAEELGEEIFVGVNFYAKHATAENLAEMTAAAERNDSTSAWTRSRSPLSTPIVGTVTGGARAGCVGAVEGCVAALSVSSPPPRPSTRRKNLAVRGKVRIFRIFGTASSCVVVCGLTLDGCRACGGTNACALLASTSSRTMATRILGRRSEPTQQRSSAATSFSPAFRFYAV